VPPTSLKTHQAPVPENKTLNHLTPNHRFLKGMLIPLSKCHVFLTFFFFGLSDSSTNSDNCSGASHFWAGFLDGASLVRVLVDLRAGFFFLTGLSTLSSGRGKTMGGPKL